MSARPVLLDFVRDGSRRGAVGYLLLAAGGVALASVALTYRATREEADALELRAAEFEPDAADPATRTSTSALVASATDVVTELATPWGRLLGDLEVAGRDQARDIALLAIEPDTQHRKIRILAESRDLPAALAYTERLQRSEALRYPLLVSHEVQLNDQYQPVRFEVSADWRAVP